MSLDAMLRCAARTAEAGCPGAADMRIRDEAYTDARARSRGRARPGASRVPGRLELRLRGSFLAAVAALVLWDARRAGPRWPRLRRAVLLARRVRRSWWSRHRALRAEERRQESLRRLAAEGLFRLDRQLGGAGRRSTGGGGPPMRTHRTDHAYARDLDVFGTASLTRLAGPVTSASGRRTLREWLLGPSPPDVVTRSPRRGPRADARRWISGTSSRPAAGSPHPPRGRRWRLSSTWAEGEPWLLERRWNPCGRMGSAPRGRAGGSGMPHRGSPLVGDIAGPSALGAGTVRRRIVAGFIVVEEGAPSLQAAGPQIRLMEERELELARSSGS